MLQRFPSPTPPPFPPRVPVAPRMCRAGSEWQCMCRGTCITMPDFMHAAAFTIDAVEQHMMTDGVVQGRIR